MGWRSSKHEKFVDQGNSKARLPAFSNKPKRPPWSLSKTQTCLAPTNGNGSVPRIHPPKFAWHRPIFPTRPYDCVVRTQGDSTARAGIFVGRRNNALFSTAFARPNKYVCTKDGRIGPTEVFAKNTSSGLRNE